MLARRRQPLLACCAPCAKPSKLLRSPLSRRRQDIIREIGGHTSPLLYAELQGLMLERAFQLARTVFIFCPRAFLLGNGVLETDYNMLISMLFQGHGQSRQVHD